MFTGFPSGTLLPFHFGLLRGYRGAWFRNLIEVAVVRKPCNLSRKTEVQLNGGMDGGMEGWRDGGMEAWRHGGMEAWMHGCMDAWMHGCMDGCARNRINRKSPMSNMSVSAWLFCFLD